MRLWKHYLHQALISSSSLTALACHNQQLVDHDTVSKFPFVNLRIYRLQIFLGEPLIQQRYSNWHGLGGPTEIPVSIPT